MSEEKILQTHSKLESIENELFSFKGYVLKKLNSNNQKLTLLTEELNQLRLNLMPVIIKENGLNKCIQQLVKKMNNSENIFIDLHSTYLNNNLETRQEFIIYSIVEESLINICKHAQSKSAKIKIEELQNKISVSISDNGKGFDVMQVLKSGAARGLLQIDSLCKELGASVSIISEPSNTNISFEIPIRYV